MSQTLRIKVKPVTLEYIDIIQNHLKAPSRSDVIRRAAAAYYYLIQHDKAGHKLCIEAKNEILQFVIPQESSVSELQAGRKT